MEKSTVRPEFQFHKGTIKTYLAHDVMEAALAFQFHKGTIKTIFAACYYLNIINFNSIKVRLKR